MGLCASKQTRELKNTLKAFSFDSSEDADLPFAKRAARELYSNLCSEKLIDRHHRVFLGAILETASAIIKAAKKDRDYPGKKIETYGNKKIVSYPAPSLLCPVLNQYWQLAVLYTDKYYELCEKLVGGVIDVPIRNPPKNQKYAKKIWGLYDKEVLELDDYVVWVNKEEFEAMCKCIIQTIESKLKLKIISRGRTRKKIIDFNKSKSVILDYIQEIHRRMTIDLKTSELHPLNSDPEVSEFLIILKAKLPTDYLRSTLISKYRLTPPSAEFYIEEYARFMTMIRFSKKPLTPSEQVDQVWHTHQFFTKNYRKFCYTLYGKFISHGPTKGGENEGQKFDKWYNRTLSLYSKLFGVEAPPTVWPPSHLRFSETYFSGRWVSIYRLIASFLQVYKVKKEDFESNSGELIANMGNIYCMWIGGNILKEFSRSDRRHFKHVGEGYSNNTGFLATGYFAEMNGGAGCGGCGGCGGHGCGGGGCGGGGWGGCGGGGCGGGGCGGGGCGGGGCGGGGCGGGGGC